MLQDGSESESSGCDDEGDLSDDDNDSKPETSGTGVLEVFLSS
ncbi:hypothetical protein Plhal304r1_c058g0144921 [Plasmopara halstedii]